MLALVAETATNLSSAANSDPQIATGGHANPTIHPFSFSFSSNDVVSITPSPQLLSNQTTPFSDNHQSTTTQSKFLVHPRFLCLEFDNPIERAVQFGKTDQNFNFFFVFVCQQILIKKTEFYVSVYWREFSRENFLKNWKGEKNMK